MVPSPKFATRIEPASLPKPAGATDTPHGAFRDFSSPNTFTRLPEPSNSATRPWPAPAPSSATAAFLAFESSAPIAAYDTNTRGPIVVTFHGTKSPGLIAAPALTNGFAKPWVGTSAKVSL